jgi:toxin ParE1/3/4
MARVLWKETALEDMRAILDFVARTSPDYADRLSQRFFASADRLESNPKLGRVVPEWNQEHIREMHVSPYRLIYVYREAQDIVYIAALVHTSRDLASLIGPDSLNGD